MSWSGFSMLRKRFSTAAMIVAVGLLPWLYWNDDVITGPVKYWWTTSGEVLSGYRNYDSAFKKVAAKGNTAIRLVGFNPDDPQHIGLAQQAFCRGAYTMYPIRAFAAERGTILNGGRDAIKANFRPSLQWLWTHDVHSVMNFTIGNDGKSSVDIQAVPPRTQP